MSIKDTLARCQSRFIFSRFPAAELRYSHNGSVGGGRLRVGSLTGFVIAAEGEKSDEKLSYSMESDC